MTIVRVNLLPGDVEKRNAARRTQASLVGVAILIMGLLGAGYLWQVGQVNNAMDELAVEEAEVQRLRGEVNELSEFQRLEAQGEQVNNVIVALLGGESSLGAVLQDIAAVMPSDAGLTSLSITVDGLGGGMVAAAGESLLGHAPGLERLLIAFNKVAAFTNVFFNSSALDETDVSTFTFDFDLTPLVLTHRYDGGLPEGLR